MNTVMKENYEECYAAICRAKQIEQTINGFKAYKSAMTSLYHAVCLDIDDTLTYKNIKEKRQVVEALARLTKRNVIICFITGRGKSNAFEFLNDLKASILAYDDSIHERQFCRWYCITNNGCMLFCFDFLTQKGFMGKSVSFVDADVRKKYMELKPIIQQEVAALLSKRFSIAEEDIIRNSNASIGENSLRFPFAPEYAESIDYSLMNELKEIVAQYTEYTFGVNRGVYHKNNKAVIEISMTTKGWAINKFEEYLGIPKNKMVRIGDQGDSSGNDYEMLDSQCGFSVGKYSSSENTCWPVVRYVQFDTDILEGIEGTTELLNTLKLFPTICLEKPSEDIYLPRLALSERKNIAANRETYEYYQNLLRYAFMGHEERASNVWDYIDEQTGAFYIHDAEYELLKAVNPDHILFKIYDLRKDLNNSKQPRLKFALKTDSGLLLRGPLNYYYGLSFRQDGGTNISLKFLQRFNQYRVHFLKCCVNALKNCGHIDIKDSITRRTLLGIMDSIRDYLLILINIRLQEYAGLKDRLYIFTEKDKELYELYNLAKQNLIYMYNCLFNNLDANFVRNFRDFIVQKILIIAKEAEKYFFTLKDFDYKKGCRVWREIDSFYENIIAVDTSINKILYECGFEKKEVLLYGIRYGSLELPIITAMLFDVKYKYFNIKYSVGALCLKSNYNSNHKEELDTKRTFSSVNRRGIDSKEYFHILMDDNLVTGRTIQIAVNMLANRNIYPEKMIVVRYPALNRIKHMFLPNHGAPDPDLFWEYVYGLTSPTPYSRLNHPYSYKKNPDDMYLDELGEFNKTRTFALNLLYKNGLYSLKGEVAQRGD